MNDTFQILGLLLAGAGLWLVDPAIALIVVGALVFVSAGLAAARERGRR